MAKRISCGNQGRYWVPPAHPRADCGATRRPAARLSCSRRRSSRACVCHGLRSSATSRSTSTVATHSQSSRARHVSSWHFSDMTLSPADVRSLVKSGRHVEAPTLPSLRPISDIRWLNACGCSARTRHPLKRINRGASFIRNSITSFGVLPRPSAAKFRVHQIRAFPAMTRCRSASVPPDCE